MKVKLHLLNDEIGLFFKFLFAQFVQINELVTKPKCGSTRRLLPR